MNKNAKTARHATHPLHITPGCDISCKFVFSKQKITTHL